jgi:hypothetical protein
MWVTSTAFFADVMRQLVASASVVPKKIVVPFVSFAAIVSLQ